jgi:hypothetical protein
LLLLWRGRAGVRTYIDVFIRALHTAIRVNRLWDRQLDDARAADDCDISRVRLIAVRPTERDQTPLCVVTTVAITGGLVASVIGLRCVVAAQTSFGKETAGNQHQTESRLTIFSFGRSCSLAPKEKFYPWLGSTILSSNVASSINAQRHELCTAIGRRSAITTTSTSLLDAPYVTR